MCGIADHRPDRETGLFPPAWRSGWRRPVSSRPGRDGFLEQAWTALASRRLSHRRPRRRPAADQQRGPQRLGGFQRGILRYPRGKQRWREGAPLRDALRPELIPHLCGKTIKEEMFEQPARPCSPWPCGTSAATGSPWHATASASPRSTGHGRRTAGGEWLLFAIGDQGPARLRPG